MPSTEGRKHHSANIHRGQRMICEEDSVKDDAVFVKRIQRHFWFLNRLFCNIWKKNYLTSVFLLSFQCKIVNRNHLTRRSDAYFFEELLIFWTLCLSLVHFIHQSKFVRSSVVFSQLMFVDCVNNSRLPHVDLLLRKALTNNNENISEFKSCLWRMYHQQSEYVGLFMKHVSMCCL